MDEFQNLRRYLFPHVIGCADGTHINIASPSSNRESYYNRHGTYSMILQAVCDANCIFTDICFGWPGRTHDAAVWRKSPLGKGLLNGSIQISAGAHILGDSAYPLSTYLMVPFRDNGHLNNHQTLFNVCLSSTRVCIEQAFGILKGRFRILKYLQVYNIKNSKYFIVTCVALHNYITRCEGLLESNDVDNSYNDKIFHLHHIQDLKEQSMNKQEQVTEAKDKRNAIMTFLSA